jgi:hypothetical protein
MNTITMTMSAVSCARSVRLRPVTPVFVAAPDAPAQGTTVSIAGLTGLRAAVIGAPVTGHVSDFGKTYPTTDVARFRSGRPPV